MGHSNFYINDFFLIFSFQHQMSLVRDASLFTQRVSRAPISGNIDNPEGGLDALMQVFITTIDVYNETKLNQTNVLSGYCLR